jgi:hypothetical protein
MDVADLIIESRTQDAETIQKVLEQSGHTNFQAETHTDHPEAEAPPAEPAPPAAAAPAPPTPAAEPTPRTEEPAPADQKPVRGYKLKLEVAREENARLKDEIAKLSRGTAPAPATPAAEPALRTQDPAPAAAPKPKPTPESFENGVYDPAYIEAVSDWKYDERRRQEREEETARVTREQDEAKRNANTRDETAFKDWWNGQIHEAKARHDDFDAVMTKDHGRPIVNPVMYEAMQSADQGAELAYWLGTHPDESERISKLTALQPGETAVDFRKKLRLAMIELSKIELPDFSAEDDDDEAPQPAAPVAAAPPAAAPAPKAAAAAAAAPPARVATPATPASKPAPPSPVGSRGAGSRKRLSQMSPEELRSLTTDQYRKLRVEEYGQ